MSRALPVPLSNPDMGKLHEKHLARLMKTQELQGFGSWRSKLWELQPRWQHLSYMHLTGKLLPDIYPWPESHFTDDHSGVGVKMVMKCLDRFLEVRFEYEFLGWILWKCGHPDHKVLSPRIEQRHLDWWEEHFDLEKAVRFETDFLGSYWEEIISKSVSGPGGIFFTPHSVCNMMAESLCPEPQLTLSAMDPCVGSGRCLLSLAGKILFLAGADRSATAVRLCLINSYFWMPQILWPPPESIKKDDKVIRIDRHIKSVLKEKGISYGQFSQDSTTSSESSVRDRGVLQLRSPRP